MLRELRGAARSLRRHPGFAAGVVLTLGLGIGANATVFTAVDRLLLSPPPYIRETGRVVRVSGASSFPVFRDLRDQVPAFERVAGYSIAGFSLGRGVDARNVTVSLVTADFFSLLGVPPRLGRFIGPQDVDGSVYASVVVLSYGLWRERFESDPGIVGRPIWLGNSSFTVVGVAPRGFTGPELSTVDAWVPIGTMAARGIMGAGWEESRTGYWLRIIARLAPGASMGAAAAQATTVAQRGATAQERAFGPNPIVLLSIMPGRTGRQSREAKAALWLAAVSLIVLLIACTNVANLLSARFLQRQHELAVRRALGSGSGRLFLQSFCEALLLALAGGCAGVLIAIVAGRPLLNRLLSDLAWNGPVVGVRLLIFTLLASLAAGLLAGIVPALQAGRVRLGTVLQERRERRRGLRAGPLLAGFQAALSLLLLAAAGLFVRSLHNVRALDLGLDAEHVVVAQVDPAATSMPIADQMRLLRRAGEQLRHTPGISRSSLGEGVPFQSSSFIEFRIPDSPPPTGSTAGPSVNAVSQDFFATIGARIVSGRGFSAADSGAAVRPVVVNESLTRHYWPGRSSIGECIVLGREKACSQVVGVVEDVRQMSIFATGEMQYYIPFDRQLGPPNSVSVFVRTEGDAESMTAVVRRVLHDAAPEITLSSVETMSSLIDPQLRPWRLGATMFTVLGLLALAVACIGFYNMVAYAVVRRTHEMGVRTALGARPGQLVWMILGSSCRNALAGVTIGVLIALVVGKQLVPYLYGVSPRDPLVLAGAALALLLAAAVASLIPAWRAARTDPTIALRAE